MDAIWLDGLERFGLAQANAFSSEIYSAFDRLAKYPDAGVALDEILPNHRVFFRPSPCKIVYRYDETTLFIVRVFHGRQDYERILTE